MKPYYVLETEDFNLDRKEFDSGAQMQLDTINNFTRYDIKPSTKLLKKDDHLQNIDNAIKYDLIVEIEEKKKGRIYGVIDFFDKWIFQNESLAYFLEDNKILILSSNKDSFLEFHNKMIEHSMIKLNKVKVDFEKIIENRHSLGIQSVWLKDIPNDINISSLGIHGNRIENTNQYNQLIAAGAKITNISINYCYIDKVYPVMITNLGGIILYEHLEDSDALPLINNVYENLIKN